MSTFTTCREHQNCVLERGESFSTHHPATPSGPLIPQPAPAPEKVAPVPQPRTHKHGKVRHDHNGGSHPHVHNGDTANAYGLSRWHRLRQKLLFLVMEP